MSVILRFFIVSASWFGINPWHVIMRARLAANQSQKRYKIKESFLKPKRPKNLRFKPAGKISFDLAQKNRTCLWERKILCQPITICQIKKFVVGLLRMAVVNTRSVTLLDAHGRRPGSSEF
jgi:hypothetical protein